MREKKILIVVNVDWFFLSHRLPIALAAKKAGFEVTIAAADTGVSDIITREGLNFIDIPELEKNQPFISELKMIFRLKRLYRKLNPDLVHHVTIRPVLYGSLAARLARVVAMVNALSGLGYVYMNNTFKHRLVKKILNVMFRAGFKHPNSRLILQNKDDIELFLKKKLIHQNKIVLIRGSGVNVDLFTPSSHNSDTVKVALIGRMLRDKGVIEFIEAAKVIAENGSEAEFHLYGAPYESNPTSISESDIQEWTKNKGLYYHGHCDNISEELNGIDIVCLPSYREGLPKSLLEAASAAKPIVTTDVPGCRDVVEDGVNGYLVPAKNVELLASRIENLINDPELCSDFGKKGREKVIQEFSQERIVKQTLDLYQELLN